MNLILSNCYFEERSFYLGNRLIRFKREKGAKSEFEKNSGRIKNLKFEKK
jgi:hypothetical protein